VSDELEFQKLCAHWVPKMLTEEHKFKQQAGTFDFLTRYSEEGKNFLSHVVTGDETWVSHEAPKSKQQSMHWRHTSSPTKTKFKQTTSTWKVMCTMIWGRKGVLLVNVLPQRSTISRGFCRNTLQKLQRSIQNKQCSVLSWGVVPTHTLLLQCKFSL